MATIDKYVIELAKKQHEHHMQEYYRRLENVSKYKDFNPYIEYGDYVEATDNPDKQIRIEAMALLKEQAKCTIPYDFAQFIKFDSHVRPPCDDYPFPRWFFGWKYYPPPAPTILDIIDNARRRVKRKVELPKEGTKVKIRRYGFE